MAARDITLYVEDLKQNWRKTNDYTYEDQFGFKIVGPRIGVTLYHKDIELIKVYSRIAAKEIARIYLNDFIIHSVT